MALTPRTLSLSLVLDSWFWVIIITFLFSPWWLVSSSDCMLGIAFTVLYPWFQLQLTLVLFHIPVKSALLCIYFHAPRLVTSKCRYFYNCRTLRPPAFFPLFSHALLSLWYISLCPLQLIKHMRPVDSSTELENCFIMVSRQSYSYVLNTFPWFSSAS